MEDVSTSRKILIHWEKLHRPPSILETVGTVFLSADRPRPANKVFNIFSPNFCGRAYNV